MNDACTRDAMRRGGSIAKPAGYPGIAHPSRIQVN